MSTPRKPVVHDRRQRGESGLFRVEEVDLEFSNGERRTYERVASSGLGAVIVVPVTAEGEVMLIREYACGVDDYTLGLPKGRLEPGEDPLDGANRELREEIGHGARDLVTLMDLTLAPGYMGHRTRVVLARDLHEAPLPGDEPEPIEVLRWPLADIWELAQRPECHEGRSIAALYLARDYLEHHP